MTIAIDVLGGLAGITLIGLTINYFINKKDKNNERGGISDTSYRENMGINGRLSSVDGGTRKTKKKTRRKTRKSNKHK